MAPTMDVHGKVVAITGGARGIGAATAREFAAAGALVAIGDVDGGLVRDTAESIGQGVIGLDLDVGNQASFEAFLDAVAVRLGEVDVLVNNAGVMPIVAFEEEDSRSIRRQVDVNVFGVLWGSQLAIQRMLAAGKPGHIVNIASAAGKLTFPGVATYSATKFAVVGLTDALAAEFRSRGITFSVILPALVRTELIDGVVEHWALRTSDPEQVARAILRATRRRRFEVAVPRELKLLYRVSTVLPHAVSAFAIRSIGGDSHMMDASKSPVREGYQKRVSGQEDDR